MQGSGDSLVARTTTDMVFDQLHEEIVTLDLLPGSRISEAEIARRMGVSRQPVRDAFNRLGNLDLLVIRPQRATTVRRFSMEQIDNTRFVRLAVELEVVERACAVWDEACAAALDENLAEQKASIDAGNTDQFHKLDYRFHELICEFGGRPLAFELIQQCKRQVDRLCVLSLGRAEEVSAVLDDHKAIADALNSGTVDDTRAIVRRHLSRLDDTINQIYEVHSDYFE